MDDDDDIADETKNTEGIWHTAPRLCSLHEVIDPVDTEKTIQTDYWQIRDDGQGPA